MKRFIQHATVNIVLYTVVYLIKTFIIWQIENPFKWIIQIPTYSGEARFGILFFYCFLQFFIFLCFKYTTLVADENNNTPVS